MKQPKEFTTGFRLTETARDALTYLQATPAGWVLSYEVTKLIIEEAQKRGWEVPQ